MVWAIVSVVGFVLVTGVVVGLARSSTARWERDHRAARAPVPVPQESSRRARAAAVAARRLAPVTRRLAPVARRLPHPRGTPLPHLHRPHLHLPHVHLPARIADRVARGALHLRHPHLHLPHLHLPHPHLRHRTRRRAGPPVLTADEEPPSGPRS
ncbi:hypothetical protein SAMN06893096_102403 [Geodermatophilus pulveris]|uniref:Uncharacterized protein n=1 Tax=Geodermatophilus pulveris TaxID=1564159 RepID=A0A239CGH7_9ACTN|nr:hypothetical protein [Geodermatophilus pulveris]SNS18584.1 hypothetical protein SAMN06893096_102403 [Geodermatophilus pulveris]